MWEATRGSWQGPGTGKTRALTRRVVKLLVVDQVPLDAVLALVFTRVNAYELHRALKAELEQYGMAMPRGLASTLHAYALRQLIGNSRVVKALPQPVRVADDYEEKNIIRPDIGKRLGLSVKEVGDRFDELSDDWQSLAEPAYQAADPKFLGFWQEHRATYGYTLRCELVWQLRQAIKENPDHFRFDRDIKHLLVDEYQDLNKCDVAVIKELAARGAQVFCSGDDDQSIYGFRRAYPTGIRDFPTEYKPSKKLELAICWRCDRRIIALGQYVVNRGDHQRVPKPMEPRPTAGEGEVHLLRFAEQEEEAKGVAGICRHLIRVAGYAPESVLVPTFASSCMRNWLSKSQQMGFLFRSIRMLSSASRH